MTSRGRVASGWLFALGLALGVGLVTRPPRRAHPAPAYEFRPHDGPFVTVPARQTPAAPLTLPRDVVTCTNVLSLPQRQKRNRLFGAVCRTLVPLDQARPRCPFCGSAVA